MVVAESYTKQGFIEMDIKDFFIKITDKYNKEG